MCKFFIDWEASVFKWEWERKYNSFVLLCFCFEKYISVRIMKYIFLFIILKICFFIATLYNIFYGNTTITLWASFYIILYYYILYNHFTELFVQKTRFLHQLISTNADDWHTSICQVWKVLHSYVMSSKCWLHLSLWSMGAALNSRSLWVVRKSDCRPNCTQGLFTLSQRPQHFKLTWWLNYFLLDCCVERLWLNHRKLTERLSHLYFFLHFS